MGSLGDKWQFVRRDGAQGAVYHHWERPAGEDQKRANQSDGYVENTEPKKSGGRDEGAAGEHVRSDDAKGKRVTTQKEKE